MQTEHIVEIAWSQEDVAVVVKELAHLRLLADIELIPKFPFFIEGKPYPLGRCKEIRDAVFVLLQERLKQPATPGLILLHEALSKGGTLTKAWGSLRDQYFQNALLLEGWYLDVSNDTVNPNKPRIEVLPLAQSGFSRIVNFEQFVQIARLYWHVDVYRNDICPALAPFLPLIYVRKNGVSWMGEASDDMLSVATSSAFSHSECILSELSSPPHVIKNNWQYALSKIDHNVMLHAQGCPVEYCQQFRTEQRHLQTAFRNEIVQAFLALPKSV
ncbi:hypothetical protein [Marinomonas sp. IMCC 4694]|uniref:hypothetical protein n=1 Tax=Marinomonas sp. IMCC 4694 TaxID=2605432 RepID=UPI0011E643D1|nr:hypothetical protein [Marinomonas sp. IMCC 4694]TYL48321.1 hypothetical protein FXV75_10420 [Marinomonas sp. IMCC 4694]